MLVEAVVRHGCGRAVGERQGGAGPGTLLHRVAAVQVAGQRSYLVPQDSEQNSLTSTHSDQIWQAVQTFKIY